jgi:hypothetical protein
MSEGYYMYFVKDVPKSTQIEWFVKKYSTSFLKQDDLRHVELLKSSIDKKETYVGVFMRKEDEYHYIFREDTLDVFKNFIEVFYYTDIISIGEL